MNKSGVHRKKRNHHNAFVLFNWPRGKDFLEETKMSWEIERWCEQNLEDDFTAANDGVYIYEASDAMAYKLRWM